MRWLAAIALVFGLAGTARADAHSVTLLGVSGLGGARFASSLESSLSELYDVVPGEVYKAEARRIGQFGAAPAQVEAVCARLRVDAVIAGAVVGKGRHRQLLIAVRAGRTGQVVARGRYSLGRRTLPLIKQRVLTDLVRALDRIHPGEATPPATVQEMSPENETPEASQTPEANETPGESEAPGEKPTAETEVEPMVSVEKGTTPPPSNAPFGVEAGVGVSLLTRTLSFDVASAPTYDGGTVYGIRAEGRVRPVALSAELAEAHPVLASFGFHGWYEHVLTFQSQAGNLVSTGHASRWAVLFEGRIPLGHHEKGGALTVETGFQELSWGSASEQDLGVPDVNYDLVDAGLSWEKAVGLKWLALNLRAVFLGLVGAGDIGAQTEYGDVGGWGLDFTGGLTARPARWLWISLAANYTRLELSFSGSGTRYARAAADQWIGGALEVGFAL